MLALALDTSTPTVTAGVVRLDAGIEALAERTTTDAFGHAAHLIPLAGAALEAAGHTFGDLDAVVVGLGPGPFTGLRVGIATADALGDALGVPVHGVPGHDALASIVADHPGDLLVVTDARRREVYISGYRSGRGRTAGPLVLAPDAIPAALAEHSLTPGACTGAGARLVSGVLDVPVLHPTGPLSLGLAQVAGDALRSGVRPGPPRPLYLRRPDATVPAARRSVLGR